MAKKLGRLFSRDASETVTLRAFYPDGVGPEDDEVAFRHPGSGWGFQVVTLDEKDIPVKPDKHGEYHWRE